MLPPVSEVCFRVLGTVEIQIADIFDESSLAIVKNKEKAGRYIRVAGESKTTPGAPARVQVPFINQFRELVPAKSIIDCIISEKA